jgi:hypothetical protein
MTGSDNNIEDVNAALMRELGKQGNAPSAYLKERHERERKMGLSPEEGRRSRSKGGTQSFLFRMRPELRCQLVRASGVLGKTMTAICEEALLAYLAPLDGAHA